MMKKLKPFTLRTLFIAMLLSMAACQAPKEKPPGWSTATGEVRPGPKTGKAVLALLKQARQASTKGSLDTAESHLERALRIEPRNPSLWLYMAKLRLYAGKSKEAVNLAKKALALSSKGRGSSDSLKSDCWQVIAHAYQKQGKFAQAQQAQEKAKSLAD